MYRPQVRESLLRALHDLILATREKNLPLDESRSRRFAWNTFPNRQVDVCLQWTPELRAGVLTLWKDPVVQEMYKSPEVKTRGNGRYFLENLSRIASNTYVPSSRDVFMSKTWTPAAKETEFSFGGLDYCVIDIGSGAGDKKKVLSFFEGVTALLWVLDVSKFDQVATRGDGETVNAFAASLWEAKKIHRSYFKDTPMILLVNKMDTLQSKFADNTFEERVFQQWPNFPKRERPIDQSDIQRFCLDLVEMTFPETSSGARVYSTCTTVLESTKFVPFIFNSIKDAILLSNMKWL